MEDGRLELKTYALRFLQWWWLFVLCVVVAVAGAYYYTKTVPLVYESAAKIWVERYDLPGAPSAADVSLSEDLAGSYVDLIKTRPVLDVVGRRLPSYYRPEQLKGVISVTSFGNVINITAVDPDPALAAMISNETAATFMSVLQDRQLSQLARFQEDLAQYGIEQDDEIVAAQAALLSVLSVIEPAIPSTQPSNDRLLLNVAVAAVLGLILASLAVLAIIYLDDRIRTPEDLKTAVGLPTLGAIPRYKRRRKAPIDSLAHDRRYSPLLESYKLLHTNFEFAQNGTPDVGSLVVTSAGVSEGKTTTAINLSISAAKQGRSVILVDANLRGPSLHQVFGLRADKGLAQLLARDATPAEVLAPTPIEGLRVVPSGVPDPDLIAAIGWRNANGSVQELAKEADLVIFDSASLLAATDTLLLASKVDAVLLVVDARRTSGEAVREAVERLRQVNANIAGVVLNRVKDKGPGDRYLRYYHRSFQRANSRGRRLVKLNFRPTVNGRFGVAGAIIGLGARFRNSSFLPWVGLTIGIVLAIVGSWLLGGRL